MYVCLQRITTGTYAVCIVIFALFSRYVHVHVQCESDSFYGNVVRLSTLERLWLSFLTTSEKPS